MLAYIANVQDWSYLGSNRWAAVTMLVVGVIGCQLAARFDDASSHLTPLALLGMLGVAALVFGIVAIVTAAQWALFALTITVVVLWAEQPSDTRPRLRIRSGALRSKVT